MPDFSKPERPQSQSRSRGEDQSQSQGQTQSQTQGQGQSQQGQGQSRSRSHGPGQSQTQSSINRWLGSRQSQRQGPAPEFAVTTGATPDLAANVPGTGCVERAREIRSAAPIKTRAERLLLVTRSPEARLRATAVAEKKVAGVLGRLGPGWRVLHSVPVGPDKPEVSHLVIGPGGVFTLSSRVWRSAYRTRPQVVKDKIEAQVMADNIRIYGETMPWISEARAQAWRTARALTAAAGEPVYVRPAVILLGVDEVRVYKPADRVEVLTRGLLLKWLERFPHELHSASVNRIYSAARRGDTWVDPLNALSPDTGPHPTIALDKPGP